MQKIIPVKRDERHISMVFEARLMLYIFSDTSFRFIEIRFRETAAHSFFFNVYCVIIQVCECLQVLNVQDITPHRAKSNWRSIITYYLQDFLSLSLSLSLFLLCSYPFMSLVCLVRFKLLPSLSLSLFYSILFWGWVNLNLHRYFQLIPFGAWSFLRILLWSQIRRRFLASN